jgi:signal transduction histidine kinase
MTAIQLRLTGFALAIVLVALMIGWAAHASLKRVSQLSDKLTRVQISSFQAADYFQAHLQELDYELLRYQVRRDPRDRQQFLAGWTNLNDWIDAQTPTLTTTNERAILDQINTNYDYYFAATSNLLQAIDSKTVGPGDTSGLDAVEVQSQELLRLTDQLVNAHNDSLRHFVTDSNKSLAFLRLLIFSSLFLLLILGATLAGLVYRDMINPLRLKLIESHAVIERQEKLASLGVLAAGVAHEIRNPLTAIKARLFTQRKALRPGSAELEDATVIGREIDRLEHIVQDVLQFARPSEPRLVKLSAARVLREVSDLLAPQMQKADIDLRVDSLDDAQLKADPEQLKQVLINLIQNAADSIQSCGRITLRERTATARLNGQPTPVVVLEVEDTGKGMTSEVQKRLFDPFFTTKESGAGLGLAIAARIIGKHGGALEFQTQVNRGTTFGIVLPQLTGA